MPNEMLMNAEQKLEFGPVAMSRAMGVPYDTYKNWRSERTQMPPVAVRCVELLLMYPRTAKKLGAKNLDLDRPNSLGVQT